MYSLLNNTGFSSGGVRLAMIESTPSLTLNGSSPSGVVPASGIARIDVNLLLAVIAGFPSEVGAVATPVARFRPRCAARIVRHPPSVASGCSSKSSWKVRCSDSGTSGAGSEASTRLHCSPRGSVVSGSVSCIGAGVRSACAKAGEIIMQQPIATRTLRTNLSILGLRGDNS